jgi:predicted nucleic acid-binding protein
MSEVALDANVLVAIWDAGDSLHGQAVALRERLQLDGHDVVLLDVCITEALSALCRRVEERARKFQRDRGTKAPPDLRVSLEQIRWWVLNAEVRWVSQSARKYFDDVLDVVEHSEGSLNFNDALLVVLHREAVIDNLASFDEDFDTIEGFPRIF